MTDRRDLDRKLIAAVERLGRALRVARQQVATDHGVSLLQLQLLEHLTRGRTERVGALAVDLDITQPTASDAIATLERKGLVERDRDPADRRAIVVRLTAEGTTLADTIAEELEPMMTATRATPDDEQAAALHVILSEILQLQRAGVITTNRSCLSCDHYAPPKSKRPARCLLLEAELHTADLRVDCAEHSSLAS